MAQEGLIKFNLTYFQLFPDLSGEVAQEQAPTQVWLNLVKSGYKSGVNYSYFENNGLTAYVPPHGTIKAAYLSYMIRY